jgi:hypothetical protein
VFVIAAVSGDAGVCDDDFVVVVEEGMTATLAGLVKSCYNGIAMSENDYNRVELRTSLMAGGGLGAGSRQIANLQTRINKHLRIIAPKPVEAFSSVLARGRDDEVAVPAVSAPEESSLPKTSPRGVQHPALAAVFGRDRDDANNDPVVIKA